MVDEVIHKCDCVICSLCLSGGVIIVVFKIGISSLINMEEDDVFLYTQMQKK